MRTSLLVASSLILVCVYAGQDCSAFSQEVVEENEVGPDEQTKSNEDIDQIEWWKKTNFYHIYIRSFKDTDGDGEGDIRGVVEELDYLQTIGVDTLLVSPFYSTPMKDIGYDIDNYTAISENFGTMEDFEDLVEGLKARNMRLVVDFVPNHSSNKHPWFECSERAYLEPERCGKYKDYYMWSNSTRFEGKFPNNWISLFNSGGPAWQWSPIRQEFYLHHFLPEQPDLNFTNPAVREEFKEIMRFWLRKNVDGIRVDSILYTFEHTDGWPDEPVNPNYEPGPNVDPYDRLLHIHTKSLPESAQIIEDWRSVANEPEFGGQKVIITEAYDTNDKIYMYYGKPEQKLADMPFNFQLLVHLKETHMEPRYVTKVIKSWVDGLRDMGWPDERGAPAPWSCWVTGNHDNKRLLNRVGQLYVDAYRFISYLAPGVPVNYYGDEIGLHDSNFNSIPQRTIDEGEPTRLVFRAPMAWTGEEPSGNFSSSADLWMPLNSNFRHNNVQSLLKEEENTLKNFIQLQKIRQAHLDLFVFGDLVFFKNEPYQTSLVLAMARVHKRFGNILMLVNLDKFEAERVNLTQAVSEIRKVSVDPPKMGKIIMLNRHSRLSILEAGDEVSLDNLILAPGQAALIKY